MKNIILSGLVVLVVLYGGAWLIHIIELNDRYAAPTANVGFLLIAYCTWLFIGAIMKYAEEK